MTKAVTDFSPESFSRIKILVVGDVMLNHYVHGDVSRISPEGPFPVLSVTHETDDLGGAAGVYANLKGLNIDAALIGVVGIDTNAQTIQALCGSDGLLLQVSDRPTIQKTRFVGNGAQMIRADWERSQPLSAADEDRLIDLIKKSINGVAALILSDYGKGTLTKKIIQESISLAQAAGAQVLVDPKGRDFSIYNGADVVTPNRSELSLATGGRAVSSDVEVATAAKELLISSGIKAIVATRSEKGMMVLESVVAQPVYLSADAREVFDVSGAGDTVIATLAAGIASGLSLADAAMMANKAAGIVVGKKGVCVISHEELFFSEKENGHIDSVLAKKQISEWKAQGLKVGFTNGCFDILHAGHVAYLNEAKRHCDRLVLGLNHDNSVRILKGPTRPVNGADDRAAVMAGLKAIDLVVLFGADKAGDDNTPVKLIEFLQPDIFFKGGDYTEAQLPEAKVVRSYGGEVKLMGLTEGRSTTNIINKIAAA